MGMWISVDAAIDRIIDNVRLKNLNGLNKLVWPYYENGEDFIVLDRKGKVKRNIGLGEIEISIETDYIMCVGHIPDPVVRENYENPVLDISAAIPLAKKDLIKLNEASQKRLVENKEIEYESEKFYFRFRKKEDKFKTFYFDIYDRTRSKAKKIGIGCSLVFDSEKLNRFYNFINNIIRR
jgi:hypothetical protein